MNRGGVQKLSLDDAAPQVALVLHPGNICVIHNAVTGNEQEDAALKTAQAAKEDVLMSVCTESDRLILKDGEYFIENTVMTGALVGKVKRDLAARAARGKHGVFSAPV